MSKINESVYGKIVSLLKSAVVVLSSAKQAREQTNGMYNQGMTIGAECTDLAEATDTFDKVVHDVTHNVDGLGEACGAAKRDEVSKAGESHKVPASLSTVKSAVLFAFENGIAFKDKEGKTLTFTALRKIRTATLKGRKDAEVEAEARDILAKGGVDAARLMAHDALDRVRGLIPVLGEGLLSSIVTWADGFIPKPAAAPEVAKKAPRKVRAKAKGGDIATDLAKAA